MLIHLKNGKALQAPGDISSEEAQTLIDNGEAVQVKSVKIIRAVRHSSSLYAGNFDAGAILAVPKEIPEGLAKQLLIHEPASVEPV